MHFQYWHVAQFILPDSFTIRNDQSPPPLRHRCRAQVKPGSDLRIVTRGLALAENAVLLGRER